MTAVDVVGLLMAAVLTAFGVRSLLRWLRADLEPASAGERVLYSLHVTARVGLWFAFAGFFVGEALTDDPAGFRWYVLVPISLAGIQMLTALALARGSADRPSRHGGPQDPPEPQPR